MKRIFVCVCASLLLMAAGGCTQYYKITDPVSGRVYYTNSWDAGRYGYTGTARFRDMRTGADVTLPSSEVQKVSKDEAYAITGTPRVHP